MPIFRHGNCVINLSEGSSFRCIASRQCAEFYLCDLQEQKEYVISCRKGKLVAVEAVEAVESVEAVEAVEAKC